jgi:hypothetical protein
MYFKEMGAELHFDNILFILRKGCYGNAFRTTLSLNIENLTHHSKKQKPIVFQ